MKRSVLVGSVVLILLIVGGIALYRTGCFKPEPQGIIAVIPPPMDEKDVPREQIAALGREAVEQYQSARPKDASSTEPSLEAFAKTVNLALATYEGGQFQDLVALRQVQGLNLPPEDDAGFASMLASQTGTITAAEEGDLEVIHHGADATVIYNRKMRGKALNSITSAGGRGEADVADPTVAQEVVEVKMPVLARNVEGNAVPASLSMFFIRPAGTDRWLHYSNQIMTEGNNSGFVQPPI